MPRRSLIMSKNSFFFFFFLLCFSSTFAIAYPEFRCAICFLQLEMNGSCVSMYVLCAYDSIGWVCDEHVLW